MAIGERLEIIRFCETPKEKCRIMNRIGLNEAQAESYLEILKQQNMLTQNKGKYVITTKGKSYISSNNRIKKIKP